MYSGNGYGSGSVINLDTNSLSRFNADVFEPVLVKMAPFGGFPNAYININNSINIYLQLL